MRIVNGYFFTKSQGRVPVAAEHLAVIKLDPIAYLHNFDMSIKQGQDINGYIFLLERDGDYDS